VKKKPYGYSARIKPFKLEIDFKQGAAVTGFWDIKNDTLSRYTKHVPVKKGDVFYHDPKRGLVLNGKPVPVKVMPPRKIDSKIGWVPKRLRIAVFYEKDKLWNPGHKDHGRRCDGWLAADTRGYWVSQGETALEAIRNLIDLVRITDQLEEEDRRKGLRVIRWHVERTKGTAKELREMERKARKTGMILEGVDWRESVSARKLANKASL